MGLKPRFFMVVSIRVPILPSVISPWMLSMAVLSASSAVAAMLLPSGLKAAVKAVSVTYPSTWTPMSTLTVLPAGMRLVSFGGEV